MAYRYSDQINHIRSDLRYFLAEEFLDKILRGYDFSGKNDEIYLNKLFPALQENAAYAIKDSLDNEIYPLLANYFNNDINLPDLNVSQDIMNASLKIQSNKKFIDIDNKIKIKSKPIKPNLEDLKYFFGPYAQESLDIIVNAFGKHRRTGIQSISHSFRTAATAFELYKNEPEKAQLRAFVMLNHDFGLEDSDWELKQYDEVVEKINKDIRVDVVLLSNHYDIILNEVEKIFSKHNISPDKKMIINKIKKLKLKNKLKYYADTMINDLNDLNNYFVSSPAIDWCKSFFYANRYTPQLVDGCIQSEKLYVIEEKTIDLMDNDIGAIKLGDKFAVKQIKKEHDFAIENKKRNIVFDNYNRKINELHTNAIVKARHLCIRDILMNQYTNEFLSSMTTEIIIPLKSVLWKYQSENSTSPFK